MSVPACMANAFLANLRNLFFPKFSGGWGGESMHLRWCVLVVQEFVLPPPAARLIFANFKNPCSIWNPINTVLAIVLPIPTLRTGPPEITDLFLTCFKKLKYFQTIFMTYADSPFNCSSSWATFPSKFVMIPRVFDLSSLSSSWSFVFRSLF